MKDSQPDRNFSLVSCGLCSALVVMACSAAGDTQSRAGNMSITAGTSAALGGGAHTGGAMYGSGGADSGNTHTAGTASDGGKTYTAGTASDGGNTHAAGKTSDGGNSYTAGTSSSAGTSGYSSGGSAPVNGGAAAGGSAPCGSPAACESATYASGNGGVTSCLLDDEPLPQLTECELQQLCADIGIKFADQSFTVIDLGCRIKGADGAANAKAATDEEARSACNAAYDNCLTSAPLPIAGFCARPADTCSAVVQDLKTCGEDKKVALSAVARTFPACQDLTLQALANIKKTPLPGNPLSCQDLDTKCPSAPGLQAGSWPTR